MILKILAAVLVLMAIIIVGGFLYQNLPHSPVTLEMNTIESNHFDVIQYGASPVFAKNLRFNHNVISYRIDEECSRRQRDDMAEALNIFQETMKVVTFTEASVIEPADIKISCPNRQIELGDSLFAAGEGGPSEIINTTFFKTILEGTIYLYGPSQCDYPVVELHELLHVFGFDHVNNPNSIMYNTSRCDQRITEDMIDLIQDLYSITPAAELRISEISAVKKGRYLDFNITVLNEGLVMVNNLSLSVYGDKELVEKTYLGEIDLGYGRTLRASNVKLPSLNVNTVEFILDEEELVTEFNKEDNTISMSVQDSKD